MRALLVLCLVAGVAYADGPRTTPYGFDHLVHRRNIDVKGHEPIPCARCHVEKKGKLVGKPGHSACFGACHGPAPVAPKRGSKLAFGDREKVCTACHAESTQGTVFTGKLPVAYPPYGLDPDFNIDFGHKKHAPVACTGCHDMGDKKPRTTAHERCAGCHDGSGAAGRGPAMGACVGCHPSAIGKPEPPRLTAVKDSVTSTFSHSRHASRGALGKACTTCHPTITTTDDTQLPRPTMQSCGVSTCHDGKGAFATTAAACTRCHDKGPERYEVHRPTARFVHAGVHAAVVTDRPCNACHALGARGDTLIANHEACTQCHADDFAKRQPEKCGACHNATEPWRRLVADRPPPDRTEFGVMLDHDKHPQDCVRCHSLRTSASQLRPPRGHASCTGAGCHSAKSGPPPTLEQCASCHRTGLADARESARLEAPWSVRATFEHGTHLATPAECRTCHTKLSGGDLVTLATPAKSTCLPCHDKGKAAFPLTGTTCSDVIRQPVEQAERPAMPGWQRAYIVAMCAIIGGAFAYTACDWGRWPRLIYHPLTGDIAMSPKAGAITINYIGTVAWGLGGAAVGCVVGWVFCMVTRRPWSDRTLHLFGAWAITGVLLAGAYYTWNLYPW